MVVVILDSNQPHYEFPNVKKNVFVAFLRLNSFSEGMVTLFIHCLWDHSLMQSYGKLLWENLLNLKYRDSQI